jgi:very-short-patch-repair endonuclease
MTRKRPSSSQDTELSHTEHRLEDEFLRRALARGIPSPLRQSNLPWQGTGRKFRADFLWPDAKLVVEVDGGTWRGGRHTRGSGYERDCEKLALACLAGYRLIKVTSHQVRSGAAVDWVGGALGLWESEAGRNPPKSSRRATKEPRQ